jgi:hypothetical protein
MRIANMNKFHFFGALLVLIMCTVPATATIYSWFCSSGNCNQGSCSTSRNMTEGVCSQSPAGTYSMVKANCKPNPTTSKMCVSVAVYGLASMMPGGEADCVPAVEVIESLPCDICFPAGPQGNPAKFQCSTEPAYGTNFSYNCNADCSTCGSTVAVGTNPAEVAGYYSRLVGLFTCPTIISYQEYFGQTCDSTPGPLKYYIPGLANCNGYVQNSNAKANLFTCL